jgi:hypothetical protein
MSLRGGTTKQSVSFRRMPFVKFIIIAQLMCFIHVVWRMRLEVTWQIASSYLLAMTPLSWCFGFVGNEQSLELAPSFTPINSS